MCLLVPFLPSCLLKIYLELKPAAHGGRSDCLLRELVTGPCSAPSSPSGLHFQHRRPEKTRQNLHFFWGRATPPPGRRVAVSPVDTCSNTAGARLNPRLGNELQLQEKRSNYMKSVPLDEPSSCCSSSGTHLQPSIIASNLQQRTYPSERGVRGDESCQRESASRGAAGAARHL